MHTFEEIVHLREIMAALALWGGFQIAVTRSPRSEMGVTPHCCDRGVAWRMLG
jgi:hypothetical protein